jgi:hypothetical protein
MNKEKSIGPRTEPCKAPNEILIPSDKKSLIFTIWEQSESY